MGTSLEERVDKKRMRKKENRILVICRTVKRAGLRVVMYFRGNGKRLGMIGMTLLFCAVYSSFSFPGFAAESGYGLNPISDEAKNIAFSKETEIDLDEIKKLDESGRVPEEFYEGDGAAHVVSEFEAAGTAPDGDRQSYAEDEGESTKFSADDWRLILVSPQHSIPEDYEFVLGDIFTIKGIGQCDERIIEDWLAMQQAAREEGIPLVICSTYRDMEYQEMLFNRRVIQYINTGLSYLEAYQRSSEYINVPNGSEHQIGLALDIATPTFLDLVESFEDTSAGKWLAKNCHRYGFILRYPKGKEFITGVEYEPWHFRYVGVEAATVIMEEGITLEEFWEEYL